MMAKKKYTWLQRKFRTWLKIDEQSNGVHVVQSEPDGMNDTYIFDFHSSAYNQGSFAVSANAVYSDDSIGIPTTSSDDISNDGYVDGPDASEPVEKKPSKPIKIKVKPKDVLDQLETVPLPFDLILIDEKIGILQDKKDLIRPGAESERYVKRELNGLIERLENRKKYNDFKEYFEKFDNTTEEKIDNLLEKYDLVMKKSDIFIPDFPDDAIEVMKSYTENLQKLCGKKPVFYVIAEDSKFEKNYKKRDPILLVQSPFGFYWQILGAWDEEMLILHML